MISKKIFLLLGLIVLLGAGCVRPAPVTPEKPIVLTGGVPGLSERDLAEIKLNVTDGGGTATVAREFDSAWKIPSAVHPGQLGQAYQWIEGLDFVLVNQRNDWTPIQQKQVTASSEMYYYGPILFTGIMMTVNGGTDWHALVAAPEYTLDGAPGRANPVGLYTTKRTMVVDFADDHGAGSGEGNLSRYVSKDGITWKLTACAYYVPETYQPTSAGPYDPPSIKATPCPKEIPMTLGPSK